MSRNIFASSGSSISREQRWEARRQAKFQQPEPYPQESKLPSSSLYDPPIQTVPDYSSIPAELYKPQPTYNNSVNNTENPNNYQNSYELPRNDSKLNLSLPIMPNKPNQGLTVVEVSPDVLKKKAYGLELQRQMEEQKNAKKKSVQGQNAEYFPFGKQGAGAPMRDGYGNIIAKRPPKYNENDPNFLNPGQFYKQVSGLSHSHSQQIVGVREVEARGYPSSGFAPQMSTPKYSMGGLQQGNSYYQQISGYNVPSNNPSNMPSNMPPNMPQNMPPNMPQNMPQNMPPNMYQNVPQYPPQNMPQYPPQYFNPSQSTNYNPQYSLESQQQLLPSYSQPNLQDRFQPLSEPKQYSEDRIRNSSDSPKPFFPEPSEDNTKVIERVKKIELGKILLQQAEEKKRKVEEEKRQKILEERLEEERLARQRREIEEQRRIEEEKGKRKIQEMQEFNSKLVLEPKGRGKRVRTPYEPPVNEVPMGLPPAPRSREGMQFGNMSHVAVPPVLGSSAVSLTQEVQKVETVYTQKNDRFNYRSEKDSQQNDFYPFKHEMTENQNKLKEEILKLKTENLEAQGQRIEAQREVQRLRDEFRQKELMDDIRQKEILSALHNTKSPYPPQTTLPPYKPLPYKQLEGRGDASLSLDPMKSLPSSTKMIPLPNPDIQFTTIEKLDPHSISKKALKLDSLFPSLPENEPNNVSYDSIKTANSSIGLEKVNKRNEERLKLYENMENNPSDELNKLDDILFKYSQPKKESFPPSRQSFHRASLDKIEEVDEADYSLPKSQAPSDLSLKWNKDWTDF